MSRYEITIPPDLPVLNLATEEPVEGQWHKFVEFVRIYLLSDKRFIQNDEALHQQKKIRKALKGKGAGDKFRLDPNEYNKLLEVSKQPQYPQGVTVNGVNSGFSQLAYQCVDYLDAIKQATKIDDEDEPAPSKKDGVKKAEAAAPPPAE